MKTIWLLISLVIFVVLLQVVSGCGDDSGKCIGRFAGAVVKGFEEAKK